ncbi:hypothetical protein LPJGGPFB_03170 [Ensifer adhaerens]|uniref:hypothetical protein n=1 Tax=Ensifer adhaerens TaxID=106592 RepID=UPI0015683599|nr:hypothetical protein [Ensifer adhaerens]NRP19912.1 hypothetical protein [Ensifer adhaerens]
MPNTSVSAAAEGVPSETFAENRIWELAREISTLLDRVPRQQFVLIHAASKPMRHHITMGREDNDKLIPKIGARVDGLHSLLLAGVDQLGLARSALELVSNALDSMGNDEGINSIQYGVSQIRKELNEAMETIEQGRRQLT